MADAVLGVAAGAMVPLEDRWVARAVGEDHLEAVPVSVRERRLRAEVGPLAPYDQTRDRGRNVCGSLQSVVQTLRQ